MGAQRKPIQLNDLPQALEIINLFKESILNDNISEQQSCNIKNKSLPSLRGKQGRTDDCLQAIGSLSVVRSLPKRSGGDVNEVDRGELIKLQSNKQLLQNNKNTLLINREEILNTDDYNLSINRYKKEEKISSEWEMVELGEVCDLLNGYAFKSSLLHNCKSNNEELPVIKIANLTNNKNVNFNSVQYYKYSQELSQFLIKKNDILFAMSGATVGKVSIYNSETKSLLNQRVGLIRVNNNKILTNFLLYLLYNDNFYQFCQNNSGGGAQPNISPNIVKTYKIPLPPLEIQEKIVKEIEEYEKIINGCREVVENWKPKFEIKEELEKVELGGVCDLESGSRDKGGALNNGIPSIGGEQITEDGFIKYSKMKYISEDHFNSMKKGILKNNDILLVKDGATTGKSGFYKTNVYSKCAVNEHVYILRSKNNILPQYLYNVIKSNYFKNKLSKYIKGIIGGITRDILEIQIPLPPLEEQEEIVAKIEEEEKYIDGCKKMIEIYKEKIKKVIDGVVGK